MNPVLTIAKKEYSLALRSLGTYIVLGVFLLAAGAAFALTALKTGLAEMRGILGIMHNLFIMIVPALTMSAIAKERATGTIELISTLPIRLWQIVWGKFIAAWLLLSTALAFTLVYLGLINVFGTGVDYGAAFMGYLGMLCAGAAFTAIGIFASSLSDNQVLVFVTGFAISAVFFYLGRVGDLLPLPLFNLLQYLGFDYHLESFLKGVLDTRDLLFFAVVSFVFLLLAELRLQSKNLLQER